MGTAQAIRIEETGPTVRRKTPTFLFLELFLFFFYRLVDPARPQWVMGHVCVMLQKLGEVGKQVVGELRFGGGGCGKITLVCFLVNC